ncbi:ATP-grasp fold amidoligase family protein [Halomonas casei]|uniref:ATP-grasp fold amidoligase family protein n=1 Tax=Halomonas TaxID=2745 RepID=UPI001866EF24|nr:ATP-grasp fold amidoligase family protein [Halomonas casei]
MSELSIPSFHEFLLRPDHLSWAQASHPARKGTLPAPPSFRAAMDVIVRRFQREEQRPGVSSFAQQAGDREWVANHMHALGVPTAKILKDDFSLQHLRDVLEGIDACVIKPKEAHSSRGVLSLKRVDEITFECLQLRCRLRLVDILERLYQEMRDYQFPNHWQLEELLLSPSGLLRPVDDFKFYAIRGRVGLILQVARQPEGQYYRWYDRDWHPVETGKYEEAIEPALLPPRNPGALLHAAERVSAVLPTPFCRIDLYEARQGPVLGELTPVPGTYHAFGEQADLYLGALLELDRGSFDY